MSRESKRNPIPQLRQLRRPYVGGDVSEQKQLAAVEMMPLTKRIRKKFQVFSICSGPNILFLFLMLVLVVIGLVTLFSASYAYAYCNYGNGYYSVTRQVVFAILDVILMLLISYFDYHHLRRFTILLLLVSCMFLVIVLFLPTAKGVHHWINLGLFGFQLSEIAKFTMMLYFTHLVPINFKCTGVARCGALPYVLLLAVTVLLFVREPHVSATVIIIALTGIMLFIGGVPLRRSDAAFGVALAGIAYLVLFMSELSYVNDRVITWLDLSTTEKNLLANTWQARQSLYAIGFRSLLGLRLGQSRQKYLCLPEPQSGLIFAIVCEELGFIGALIIVILFALLIWHGVTISPKAKGKFDMLLGISLTLQVDLQVVLNIAIIINTIPDTGISLPFLSHGGTSLALFLAQMGVMLPISRTPTIEETWGAFPR